MKHAKLLVLLAAVFSSSHVSAAELTVSAAQVSRVQVYETTDGSTSVWLWLNGNGRVGPNPANASLTCELWTSSKAVHASALAAMLSGKKIDVTYLDNSNGSYWCKVKTLAVVSE
jgi:hypothetical protein